MKDVEGREIRIFLPPFLYFGTGILPVTESHSSYRSDQVAFLTELLQIYFLPFSMGSMYDNGFQQLLISRCLNLSC